MAGLKYLRRGQRYGFPGNTAHRPPDNIVHNLHSALAFGGSARYICPDKIPATMIGILHILACWLIGNALSQLTGNYISGNIIGMVLLFAALCLKIVKPEPLKPVARFLCDNMGLFFIPAGVGVVNALDILSRYWEAVLLACAVSTVIVMSSSPPFSNGLKNTV